MGLVPSRNFTGTEPYSPEDVVDDNQGGLGTFIASDVDAIEVAMRFVGADGRVIHQDRGGRAAGFADVRDGRHSGKRVEMARDN